MKFLGLLLFGLVILASSSVDAWGVRVRRIVQAVCRSVCSTTCHKACPVCLPVCHYGCSKICGKRNARSVAGTVPMPCDFKEYDFQKDGHISPDELGKMRGGQADDADVQQLFKLMDSNGDGQISPDEFEAAPLLRDCDTGNGGNKRDEDLFADDSASTVEADE